MRIASDSVDVHQASTVFRAGLLDLVLGGHGRLALQLADHLASIEFEVADVEAVRAATDELEARGFALLHSPREEPWGQTVGRLLSPEGLIVGVSFAPSLHEDQRE